MQDWISVYFVLWVLRSLEYLHVGRSGAVVFRGRGNGRCSASPPAPKLEGTGPTLFIGHPFDPFSGAYVSGTGHSAGFDVPEIMRLLSRYEGASKPLLRAEVSLAAHLFVVVPVVWAVVGIAHSWVYLLGGTLVLQAITIVEFGRAYRAMAEASGAGWIWKALPLLLSPPAATAGHPTLTKPLLAGYHPAAVAAVLCSEERFRAIAIPHLRWIEFPSKQDGADRQGEGESPEAREARRNRIQSLRRIIAERLGGEAAALAAPPRRAAAAVSYCPRCLSEYSVLQESCADCPGVALKPFELA